GGPAPAWPAPGRGAGLPRDDLLDDGLPGDGLPGDRLSSSDLAQVRFSLGLRGYRMDEVDEVLDRAGVELDARDAQIHDLRDRLALLEQRTEQRVQQHADAEER
ncbi:MAG: DivIVA domain-containing protein, partial [Rhodoferax sp.]|nr:DivIVA domain-containing protein [Actinomycetota bacterium]